LLGSFFYNLLDFLSKGLHVRLGLFVFIFLVGFNTTLLAHPHIFIDVKVLPEADKTTISWSFDAMTSAMLIKDYDQNKDKQLDSTEIAFIEKDHFLPLAEFSYFMRLFDGKKEIEVKKTQTFHASIEKKRLVYTFSIPQSQLKTYELRFFDPEMYVAMILKPDALLCAKGFTCKAQGYDADYYYGYKASIAR
jgi:ABC-type uncharacterized transport system substrate-binding protein